MKVGLIGFAGVGKTTLFSALTGQVVETHSPGEKHVGQVEVVDRRLDHLREIFKPRKFTRTRFEVEDLPALPQGEVRGRGELLSSLREPEALILVVGAFEQARMTLNAALADPLVQLQSLRDDLLLLDLEIAEKRLARIEERFQKKPAERAGLEHERNYVAKVRQVLESGATDLPEPEDKEEQRICGEMRLFLQKPRVSVFNLDEGFDSAVAGVQKMGETPFSAIVCATIEQEIAQIEGEDRAVFLQEFGLQEPVAERMSRLAYEALNLISFFTVGPDEVRAWPVKRDSSAVVAAGKIHTDLARGFIRAEVTSFDRIKDASDEREYKNLSKSELKGKEYEVQDGDIIEIRSGV